MKKRFADLFDSYRDDTVDIKGNDSVSVERITELTKMKIEEGYRMNTVKVRRKWLVPLAAILIVAAISCTAFAAHYFLSPKEVASQVGYYKLAECFDADDTIFDMEPQTSGEYTIALLGVASGANLNLSEAAELDREQTYVVGAIRRTDGTALTDYTGLMVTPLVSGYAPWQVNIFAMGGGRTSFLYEGVEYFLLECDSLNIFADHTVYIAVYEGMAPGAETFCMKEDGSIAFTDEYAGTKGFFTVPLDASKADPAAADALLSENGITKERDADDGAANPESENSAGSDAPDAPTLL